jgi:hypothetical protein
MGAGTAPYPDRGAQWRPRRARLALAASLGVHLLAALWLQQHTPAPAPAPPSAEAPRAISILLQPPAVRTRAPPAPAPAPVRAPTPTPARAPAVHAPRPAAAPAQQAATPAPSTPVQPPADTLAAPAPAPADAATLARDPAAAANGSFMVGVAKRQAGRVDRELRGGKSGVPLEADTPWARFQRGLEAAHVERSMSVTEDSYTAPDGVVIYRRRIGSRTLCYRTGSVGLGIAGARGVNEAGPVTCPSGVTWSRE